MATVHTRSIQSVSELFHRKSVFLDEELFKPTGSNQTISNSTFASENIPSSLGTAVGASQARVIGIFPNTKMP